MKLILACEIYPPDAGGPATFVKRLDPVLRKQGYDLGIITYAGGVRENDGVVRISKKNNLLIRYGKYFLALLKMAKGADLIFAQGPVAAGLPAILVKKLTGKKVIIKVVGDVAWERSKNRGMVEETVDEFQSRGHNFFITCHKKLRGWTLNQADLVITPSQYLKRMLVGWGVNKEKIKVIYNSFESHQEALSRELAKSALGLEGEIILSVGRLTSWKGFGCLIEIMPRLLAFNPDFKLMIVGTGPEENSLKLKTQSLKLEDKVIFAGQKTQAEIPNYYAAADLFILNSGYEGLSHTLLESLSYGLPTAASRIGGNPEVIEHNFNGLLFKYNNQQQILDSIKNLSADSQLQQKFVNNSKQVLEKFVFTKMVDEYLKVLSSFAKL